MTLIIAIGNPQRGDDGAAVELCRILGPGPWTILESLELTPEMAETVGSAGKVVIADADYRAGEPQLRLLDGNVPDSSPLTHSLSPEGLIATARLLFGFQGEAWLLGIPGEDFGLGRPLSAMARANIESATRLVRGLLSA
jgi:hydrogenase maturation protease